MAKRVGVLTGGGDCPGLNPAIRGIIQKAKRSDWSVVGIRKGWKGMLTGQTIDIPDAILDDLLLRGGTILGSSRTNPYKEADGLASVKKTFSSLKLDALIAIGGEDTVGVASKLYNEGLPIVGLPKTIDNDLEVTDFTLGFPTAVQIVSDALDRIRTTAESHERVLIVEIMGRHAGWLAAYGGLAGGADLILTPEFPTKIQEVIDTLTRVRKKGKNFALVAIAEGAVLLGEDGKEITEQSAEAVDSFGHTQLGGIAERLAGIVKKKTGYDTRATVLGHLQRGGTPTAFDRILSTAFGVAAMDLVIAGKFGHMPALSQGRIKTVALKDAVAKLKTLSPELHELTKVFFG
jgi:ATP-dependent phosphofructokinase / diphosphate-dependent phosphofructokinase